MLRSSEQTSSAQGGANAQACDPDLHPPDRGVGVNRRIPADRGVIDESERPADVPVADEAQPAIQPPEN